MNESTAKSFLHTKDTTRRVLREGNEGKTNEIKALFPFVSGLSRHCENMTTFPESLRYFYD
jgi:hypothetical protein